MHGSWECHLGRPWGGGGRTAWRCLRELGAEPPYDPAVPPLGVRLGSLRTCTCKDTHTPAFTAASFTAAETWKPPERLWQTAGRGSGACPQRTPLGQSGEFPPGTARVGVQSYAKCSTSGGEGQSLWHHSCVGCFQRSADQLSDTDTRMVVTSGPGGGPRVKGSRPW